MSSRVLVTGAHGFIGAALCRSLRRGGYDVWGVTRSGDPDDRILRADLADAPATARAVRAAAPAALVHTAALAHGQPPPPGESYSTYNLKLTVNLLEALGGRTPRFVFLSSVAVYGEDHHSGPVAPTAAPRPATDYARSKLLCERRILASPLEHCDILRLAPVYDRAHLRDVRKRVFLPGPLPVKFRLRPPPRYSLCHLETVCGRVVELLDAAPAGRTLENLADPEPLDQNQLASWFPGRGLPVPVRLLRPVYWLAHLLPGERGYRLRCLYRRLLDDNVYPPERVPAA